MARAKVNHSQPIGFLAVSQCDVTIARPNLVLSVTFRVADLSRDIGQFGPIKVALKCATSDLAVDSLPGKPLFDFVFEFPPRFAHAPNERSRIEAWRLAARLRPFRKCRTKGTIVGPLLFRIEHDDRQSWGIFDGRRILWEALNGEIRILFELRLDELSTFLLDLVVVERGASITHYFFERRLESESESIRANLSRVKSLCFQCKRGVVDRRCINFWLTQREPKLRKMRCLVSLPARRFEKDGCSDAAVNVFEWPFAVRVERLSAAMRTGNVAVDRGIEARFPELSENDGPEF